MKEVIFRTILGFLGTLILPLVVLAQSSVSIDFTNPNDYSGYPYFNPTYPKQLIGDYVGPYKATDTVRVSAKGYYCYPDATWPGGTRCGGTMGVYAYTIDVRPAFVATDVTLELAVAEYGYSYFGGSFSMALGCTSGGRSVGCTNTCSITGVERRPDLGPNTFFAPASGASVSIHCPEPLWFIDFSNNLYAYVFAKSVTIGTALNLKADAITIPSALPTDDGGMSVTPAETPIEIDVQVSGSGFTSPENRNTTVTLQVGTKPPMSQTVSLANIQSHGGTLIVPFMVPLTADDAGPQPLTVKINPVNSPQEANTTDNQTVDEKFYVLCRVQDKGVEVPWFYQSQLPWGEHDYANQAPVKMHSQGCMVTSLAMLFKFYGIDMAADGTAMDPGSLNKGLMDTNLYSALGPQYSSYNGYTPSGAVQPNGAVAYARNSYFMNCARDSGDVEKCVADSKSMVSFKQSSNAFSESSRRIVNKELCEGNPVILKVPSISAPDDPSKAHFVLATGMKVDASGHALYFTNNPASHEGKNRELRADEAAIRGYRLYRPTDDPSMVFFHLAGDADMIVTDPLGKRSGYNPLTQETYSEIPGGTYISAESISDPFDANVFTPPEVRFEGMAPVSGQYLIQIFGKSNTSYRLTRYSFDQSGTINGIDDKSGTLAQGASEIVRLEHSDRVVPIELAALNINKASFIDAQRRDMAHISGSIAPVSGHSISSIKKYLQIKIGSFSKSIDIAELNKSKLNGEIIYSYGSIGKEGLVINLNVNTNEFHLVVGNAQLDSGEATITTDVMIQADDVIARGLVTFNNVRRGQDHVR